MKIDLRKFLKSAKVSWPVSDRLPPIDFDINRLIEKLDEIAIGYEARWGVYRLESLAEGPLAEKWDRQVQKINQAIQERNLGDLEGLVEGAKRGYDALEKNALAKGHKPCDPDYWEIRHNSKIYRVVKTMSEARALHKPGAHDVVVLPLEQVANIYDSQNRAVFDPKPTQSALVPDSPFQEDPMPWKE